MRRSTIAVLVLALSGTLATRAAAEPAGVETYSIRVPVSDADFANEVAVHALYTRVQDAANDVCDVTLRDAALRVRTMRACRSDVLAQAIERAAIPALTRHYAAIQSGETPGLTTEIAVR